MILDDDFEAKVEAELAAMPDNQPRYTTARLRREVAEAKRLARIHALEEAAHVVERLLKFADTTSGADKEILSAIRALMQKESP